MSKYMLIYKGEATDTADMTPEQQGEVFAKWDAWMKKVGPAMTDLGTPFGPGSSIVDDGSRGDSVALTGYSIIEAGSMDAAIALTDGHPYLSEGKGNYAIQVHELQPVPFPED
jgi:hypothetical protein